MIRKYQFNKMNLLSQEKQGNLKKNDNSAMVRVNESFETRKKMLSTQLLS